MLKIWPKKPKTEKDPLAERIRKAGLNPKSELAGIAFLGGLGVLGAAAIYYFFREIMLSFVFLGAVILFLYAMLGRYKKKAAERDELLEEEFVRLFTYFSIYAQGGLPVYGALEELTKFASPLMENRLRDLLHGIDNDKSLAPYIRFASSFSNLAIKEVMIAVYKMVDEGVSETYLRQYAAIFDSLAADKQAAERERHKKSLANVSFFPLLASGLTSALITIGIMTVIGGLSTNGF
jgi:hypothetical protein